MNLQSGDRSSGSTLTFIYQYGLVLVLLVMMVYVPVLFFPYLLLDDNWLVRGSNDVPYFGFIGGIQGRPVFGVLIGLTRLIISNSDEPNHVMIVMTLVRGLAIVGLCGFAVGFFKWLLIWGHTLRVAFVTVAVTLTLPSLAMYVLGGPWLTVALVGSLLSVYFIWYAVVADNHLTAVLWALGALLLLGLCWATYQGTAPVAAALVMVVFIGSTQKDWEWTQNFQSLSQRARFVLLGTLVFLFSLFLYLVFWMVSFNLLIGEISETRYSPYAINMLTTSKLAYFFESRLVQIMNLWSVSSLSKSVFFWVSLVSVLLAVTRDWFSQQSTVFVLAKWLLVLVGLLLMDFPALSGNASANNPVPVFSYMTSGALAVAFAGIFSYRFYPLLVDAGRPRRDSVVTFFIGAVALTLSMRLVLMNFAVPLWLEYRYVRSEVELFKTTHGAIEGVRIAERKQSLLGTGLQEFSWSNLQSAFYIHWMIKNVLDELNLKSRIRIDVMTAEGDVVVSPDYDHEPNPSQILSIHTNHLRLD
jgi:hypothetical protein